MILPHLWITTRRLPVPYPPERKRTAVRASCRIRPTSWGEYRLENLREGANPMIRRILAVIAIVIGVLAIFTSHAFGISALHLLAVGVIVLGVAVVLGG